MSSNRAHINFSSIQGFDDSNIISILTGPCGIGKTTTALRNAHDSNVKTGLVYQQHEIIEEITPRIPDLDYIHWQGFKRLCKRYHTNAIFVQLHDYFGLPKKILCSICSDLDNNDNTTFSSDCLYKKQFRARKKIVFTPNEYLRTKYMKNYGIERVFIDEPKLTLDIIKKPNIQKLHVLVRHLNTIELFDRNDITVNEFLENIEFFRRGIQSFILRTLTSRRRRSSRYHKGSLEHIEHLEEVTTLNLFNLEKWVHFQSMYGEHRDYGTPLIFYAFDHAVAGIKIFLLDAYPPKDFLQAMVNRYNMENETQLELNYHELEHTTNVNSKVFRIVPPRIPNAWYPLQTLSNIESRNNIKKTIELILDYHRHQSVGFVTYQRFEQEFRDLIGPNSLHFNAVRSSNILRDCEVLIVIGTYNPNVNELKKLCVLYFNEYPDEDSRRRTRGDWAFTDRKLEMLREALGLREMYHAIHRSRVLIYNGRIVYVLGIVPDKIKEELTYHKIQAKNFFRIQHILSHFEKLDYKSFLKTIMSGLEISRPTAIHYGKLFLEMNDNYTLTTRMTGRRGRPQYVVIRN